MNQITNPDSQSIKEYFDKNKVFSIKSIDVFTDTVERLNYVATIADRIIPIKTYLDLIRNSQQEASAKICLDDEFLAACDFLSLEISLFSAVYFMRGTSVDFKETKYNRNPIDLENSTILADLRHKLSKPNEIRGAVESNTIQTCYSRLVRRLNLFKRSPEIIKRMQVGVSKQEVMREFNLTLTDFELVYKIAQRENLISPMQRRRDQDYRYILTSSNQAALQEYTSSVGVSNQEMVNDIVEKFFAQLEEAQQKSKSKKSKTEA
jgi:hypothetical protein